MSDHADTVREARDAVDEYRRRRNWTIPVWEDATPEGGEWTQEIARVQREHDEAVDGLFAALAALERERDEAREAWDLFAARMIGAEKRAEAAERERDTLRAALAESLDLLEDTAVGNVNDGQQEWQDAFARIHDVAGKPQRASKRPWESVRDEQEGGGGE